MRKRISVVDVETPNLHNDRICSIGITNLVDGKIVSSKSFLVDPECSFNAASIKIHNITPEMVVGKPSFDEIWSTISSDFGGALLVAHNALFDLNVLKKVFRHYGITVPAANFVDTLAIARAIFPTLPNHKLNTLCDFLGIELNHHNAESDSLATAKLFLAMCANSDCKVSNFISEFDFSDASSSTKHEHHYNTRLSDTSVALCELREFLGTITCDGVISKSEFIFLEKWIERHPYLHGEYPYDAICTSIQAILTDGLIEANELEELLSLCNKLIDPVHYSCCACSSSQIEGKNIVLSGEFCHGSKAVVEKILSERGAVIQKGVTKKTNFVLVGDCGSDAWVAGNYGTKVKKAMELQEKGVDIAIIREKDFFKELNL